MFNPQRITGHAPARYKHYIETFGGVDTANTDGGIAPGRSPDARNFTRGKIGEITKRWGFCKSPVVMTPAPEHISREILEVRYFGGYNFIQYEQTDESTTPATVTLDIEIIHPEMESEAIHLVDDLLCEELDINVSTVQCANIVQTGGYLYIFVKGKHTVSDETKDFYVLLRCKIDRSFGTMTWHYAVYRNAYSILPTPTIIVGGHPSGGGTTFRSPSMLTPRVTEGFCVSAQDIDANRHCCPRFQFSLSNLSVITDNGTVLHATKQGDDDQEYWINNTNYFDNGNLTAAGVAALKKTIKVEVRTATGDAMDMYEWQTIQPFTTSNGSYFNPEIGAIWIPAASIGASPVDGEDNVRITYIRNMEEYEKDLERIFSNDLWLEYGVDGYNDRLFSVCDGNRIYYSEMDDPLMICDLNYVELGNADTKIKVVNGVGPYLYAVDQSGMTFIITGQATASDDANTFVRDARFLIADRVQGAKPVRRGKAITFGEEFVYLSEEGLTAIYHDNVYDTRHAQCRSRMLDGVLAGKDLSRAVMTRHGDFLCLALGKEIFVLDEKQVSTHKQFPYSGKQYEAYIWDFANGFADDFTLIADTETGPQLSDGSNVYLHDESLVCDTVENGSSYPIAAYWTTPCVTESDFMRRKNSVRVALQVANVRDAFKLEYRVDHGPWHTLEPYTGRFCNFDYGKFDYGMFSYQAVTDIRKRLIKDRRKMRRYTAIEFRITNDRTNYGLTVQKLGWEYTQEVV